MRWFKSRYAELFSFLDDRVIKHGLEVHKTLCSQQSERSYKLRFLRDHTVEVVLSLEDEADAFMIRLAFGFEILPDEVV